MDPTGPSQPPLNTAYDHPGNPATQSKGEKQSSNSTSASIQRSDPTIDKREGGDAPVPSSHGEGPTPSSLGYGARDSSGDAGASVRQRDLIATRLSQVEEIQPNADKVASLERRASLKP